MVICRTCLTASYTNMTTYPARLKCEVCGFYGSCTEINPASLKPISVPTLTDNSTVNFGKYNGTKLANVPASYLLWLHKQDWFKTHTSTHYKGLKKYIDDNMDVLQSEINNRD